MRNSLHVMAAAFALTSALAAQAQTSATLTDLGTSAPTPGASDIFQLSNAGDVPKPDSLNYYTDNQVAHNAGEPGQTFTTGGDTNGYVLTSLALKTGGGTTSGLSSPHSYLLHIYSVSGGAATPIASFSADNFSFNDGDWLQWSGFSVPLSSDTTYGYSFGLAASGNGWEAVANASNNLYTAGEIGLFPPSGGTITFSSSHEFDGVFDLGLTQAGPPTIPAVTNVAATGIQANLATIGGRILSTGGSVPQVTVYYGTSDGGTNAAAWSNSVALGQQSAAFAVTVTGLSTNTTYYFTAEAVNSAGAAWAAPSLSFTTQASNPAPTLVAVLTYHNDNTRSGANTNETVLTPANVNVNSFGKLFSYSVDGQVYAQPLIVSNLTIPGKGVHNVVYVATEHDSVYAFDADNNAGPSGGLIWSTNLGISAVMPNNDFGNRYGPYHDLTPEMGITGTPVIDLAMGTIYLDVFTHEGSSYFHRIHALDITNGQERPYSPVLVAASVPGVGVGSSNGVVVFNPEQQFQRPALTLAGGKLFVAYGSYADTDPYHGWVLGFNAANLQPLTNYIFNTTPNATTSVFGGNAGEGALWMAGNGLSVDANTNLYFETANGSFSANTNGGDYSDSFMRLSTTNGLAVADYFTPYNQASLAASDADLGSGGPLLLPDSAGSATHPHLIVGCGKEGKIYLVDRDNMGHYNSANDSQIVESLPGAVGGTWSSPAYFNHLIFYQGNGDVMKAFAASNAYITPTPVSRSSTSFGFPGATPSISADGTNDAIAWIIQADAYSSGGPAVLHAYNAYNLAQELYNSSQNLSRDNPGGAVKMSVPTIADGKVYVGAQYELSVFGLASFLPAPVITPSGGVFTNSATVALSDSDPGAAIYYTLDGTTPTASSTLYTGPFSVTETLVVRAVAVESGWANSAVASANFINSLSLPPPPWITSDIGSVAAAGSAFYSNGVFIVSGSGADIWNTADAFRYLYQPLTNGCDIQARVTSQGNTDPWAKAGVMIRGSLAASSAYALMLISPGNGFDFQYRSADNISSDGQVSGGALNTAPNNWVRLTRTNNTFTAYESTNGAGWTLVGTATISMTNTVYFAGLAVTAHNDGAISTGTFDNVTVNGFTYSNQPPVVVLSAPTNGSSYTATASLTLSADADSQYSTVTRVDFYMGTTFLGSATNLPYTLTATGVGAGSYALTAVATDGSGLSSTSAPVNITVAGGSGQPYGLTSVGTVPPFLNMPTTFNGSLPPLLSETGVFSNTPSMTPVGGLIPYAPNVILWSDGAVKVRYMAVPNTGAPFTPNEQITFAPTGSWSFPAGTVFVKTFELQTNETDPNSLLRLETRFLVRDINGAVYGVTYKWRPDNSDADLLTTSATQNVSVITSTGVRTQTWYYPSPADCLTCHTPAANYVLGISTRQLNGNFTYLSTSTTDNQLRTLNRVGLLNPAFNESSISTFEKLSALTNLTASFEERARSYLDANCAQCHQPGGTGPTFDARYETPLASQNIVNAPVIGNLGYDNARVVAPKDVWRSILYDRMNTTDKLIQMPPLARNLIDSNAVTVLTAWINSLPGTPALPPPVITPTGGIFAPSVTVTLAAPDTNATIYYTLDGTLPTTKSLQYVAPFTLTSNATVRASAFEIGFNNSVAASANFIVQPPLLLTSSHFTNNEFQFTLSGVPGKDYVVEATTNFMDWIPISTNPAVTNLLDVIDPKATNYSYRFYRALQQ